MSVVLREPILWVLAVCAVAYGRGYLTLSRLAALHGHSRARRRRQLASTATAVACLLGALLGPVDEVAAHSFAVHMVQHLLLLIVVPPLLVLGAPWTPLLRGLSPRPRSFITRGRTLAPLRRAFSWLDRPWPAWIALAANLWFWHIPSMYGATLQSPPVHYVEHALFAGTGVLWWLQVVDSAPLRAKLDPIRMIGPQVACMVNGWILAMWLSYAPSPLYRGYAVQAHLVAGMSALNDQRVGASFMWVFGGIPYGLAIALRAYGWLARPDRDWRLEVHGARRRWTAIGAPPPV